MDKFAYTHVLDIWIFCASPTFFPAGLLKYINKSFESSLNSEIIFMPSSASCHEWVFVMMNFAYYSSYRMNFQAIHTNKNNGKSIDEMFQYKERVCLCYVSVDGGGMVQLISVPEYCPFVWTIVHYFAIIWKFHYIFTHIFTCFYIILRWMYIFTAIDALLPLVICYIHCLSFILAKPPFSLLANLQLVPIFSQYSNCSNIIRIVFLSLTLALSLFIFFSGNIAILLSRIFSYFSIIQFVGCQNDIFC